MRLKYSPAMLGLFWSLLHPFLLIAMYTFLFAGVLKVGSPREYLTFLLSGMIPWLWTAEALNSGTACMVVNGVFVFRTGLFAVELLPFSATVTSMVGFAVATPLLLLVILVLGGTLGSAMLALPLVIVAQFLMLLGLVFILSTINVLFRDLQHGMTHLLNGCFFLHPILYPMDRVPEIVRPIMQLSPLTILIESYHAILLRNELPNWNHFVPLVIFSVALCYVGRRLCIRYKESFSELV